MNICHSRGYEARKESLVRSRLRACAYVSRQLSAFSETHRPLHFALQHSLTAPLVRRKHEVALHDFVLLYSLLLRW